MAIFLMALSSWLAVRAAARRGADLWIVLAAAVMVLADATKWVTALWSPVIVTLVVLTAPTGWIRALARGARLLSYAVGIAAPALFILGAALSLGEIKGSTTDRAAGGSPSWLVLWTAAPIVAVVLVLAVLGIVLSWRERARRRSVLCAVLVVAALLAPVSQAYDQTTVSLYKHVVFGLWFGAMAAGYALSRAVDLNAAKAWRVGLAAAVFTGLVGFDQASGFYGFWPNTTRLMAAVERDLPARGRILMQNGDEMVAYYYLLRRGVQPHIMSSYGYPPDVVTAMIERHQVWMVETDTGTGIPADSIRKSKAGTPAGLERAGYRRLQRIRWRDPDGAVGWFTIWLLDRGR
jgi:hypothetical protein